MRNVISSFLSSCCVCLFATKVRCTNAFFLQLVRLVWHGFRVARLTLGIWSSWQKKGLCCKWFYRCLNNATESRRLRHVLKGLKPKICHCDIWLDRPVRCSLTRAVKTMTDGFSVGNLRTHSLGNVEACVFSFAQSRPPKFAFCGWDSVYSVAGRGRQWIKESLLLGGGKLPFCVTWSFDIHARRCWGLFEFQHCR